MSEAVNPAERKREARYHHGDLRAALLDAGEAELAEKGYAGFTLRGTAKRAGVSHAAPAHHFRDANALLTALAARGFARLSAAMQTAQAVVAPDPEAQLVASGIGYFRFGLENPALLQLMFGPARPERKDPALRRSGEACFGILLANVSACCHLPALEHPDGRLMVAAAWSTVHRFTMLALARQLEFLGDGDRGALEGNLAAMLAGALGPLARPPAKPIDP